MTIQTRLENGSVAFFDDQGVDLPLMTDGAKVVGAKTNPLTGGLELSAGGVPVTVSGGPKVWRGMAQGMTLVSNTTTSSTMTGGTNGWSKTGRTRHYSNSSFRRCRVVLACFYTVTTSLTDTLYPDDYNFQVGFELDYANSFGGAPGTPEAFKPRKMFRFSDSTIAEYRVATPPTNGYIISDVLDLGRDVSAKEVFGLWTTVEAAAKAGNSKIPFCRNSSNYLQKYIGTISSGGVSQIALDSAQSATSVTPTTSTQGGVSAYYTPAMLLIETDAGTETVFIDGASNTRGTGEGGAGSGEYGDATGDANANLGFVSRGVDALGWNYINFGCGSDAPQFRMTADNWKYRLALSVLANPTKWFCGLGRGDMSGDYAATHVNGSTYSKPASVTASSNWYVLLKAGAGVTTVTPSGTGSTIVCGDYVWAWVGPFVSGLAAGGVPVVLSRLMRYVEMVRAAVPGIPITWHVMSTGTSSPSNTSTVPGVEIGLWSTPEGQTGVTGVSETNSRRSLLNANIKAGQPLLNFAALVDINDIIEDPATQKWVTNGTPYFMTVDGAHYNSYACSLAAKKITKDSFPS